MTADELIEALKNPSPNLVEAWSRATASRIWRRIDEHKTDDDWHGGAALNLQKAILAEDREAIKKLATAIELTICSDEPLKAKSPADLITPKKPPPASEPTPEDAS